MLATGGGGLATSGGALGLPAVAVPPEVEAAGFFHGVAEPLFGPIPGNTDTGFADESAATDWTGAFATGATAGVVDGGRRRFGGGGGAATAFGLGGTSSR